MQPSLAARSRLEPTALILVDLAARKTPLPEALLALGAKHNGQDGLRAFRYTPAGAADGLFVHALEVPGLLGALLARTAQLFSQNQSVDEDLQAAAFLAWGINAIHPFENQNGRVAVDLAQYALQIRWHQPMPPLALPDDAHRTLGSLFAAMNDRGDGTPEGLVAAARRVARRISAGPQSEPALLTAAAWLALALPTPLPAAEPSPAGGR